MWKSVYVDFWGLELDSIFLLFPVYADLQSSFVLLPQAARLWHKDLAIVLH